MANEKKPHLTKEQRAALNPAFKKFVKAYDELKEAVAAAVGPREPDLELGICMVCEAGGGGDNPVCTSFLGTGRICQRDFCRHLSVFHT